MRKTSNFGCGRYSNEPPRTVHCSVRLESGLARARHRPLDDGVVPALFGRPWASHSTELQNLRQTSRWSTLPRNRWTFVCAAQPMRWAALYRAIWWPGGLEFGPDRPPAVPSIDRAGQGAVRGGRQQVTPSVGRDSFRALGHPRGAGASRRWRGSQLRVHRRTNRRSRKRLKWSGPKACCVGSRKRLRSHYGLVGASRCTFQRDRRRG